MQVPTIALSTNRLKSVGRMSTSYIPKRLIMLATQKKKPLIIKELIFSFSISTNAKDTKELKPALSTMMTSIKNIKFWKMGRYRESCMITAAISPKILRNYIILIF